jgi:uncharacterized protein YdhG (YjbR/CyaY superfamily)
MQTKYRTVGEYMKTFPADVRSRLQLVRRTIQKTVPGAGEKITYQIPTFTFHGNLVSFGAWKGHIGLYPGAKAVQIFKKDIAKYQFAKGSIRFPFDKPLPLPLIRRIVKFRMKQNLERTSRNPV